jgi:hypothetical protein
VGAPRDPLQLALTTAQMTRIRFTIEVRRTGADYSVMPFDAGSTLRAPHPNGPGRRETLGEQAAVSRGKPRKVADD